MKISKSWASLMMVAVSLVMSHSSFSHEHQHHAGGHQKELDKQRPAALSGSSLYQLDSRWKNQDGSAIQLSKFNGHPVVLVMAYTQCKSTCPILISDMKRIEQGLSGSMKDDVRFVLVSFDSKRETPATLKSYFNAHALNEKQWTLLTSSDEGAVRELAAALGVRYKQEASGDFSHSNVISILNPQGEIVHQQTGLRADPQESIDALKKR
jgi:protein SCO1/2